MEKCEKTNRFSGQLCAFILKISLNQWKWQVTFVTAWLLFEVNYLSQSPWGSLLESPWTDLTWISSPNRSCSIWRDTPVHTCRGNKYLPALWPQTRVNKCFKSGFRAQVCLHGQGVMWCNKLVASLPAMCRQHFTVKASSHRLLKGFNTDRNQSDESISFQSNEVKVSCCINSRWACYGACSHTLKLHSLQHSGPSHLLI